MPSTFFGLNTALSGLLTNQRALDTTNHNLANLNTEGYTRQRVQMSTTLPYSQPGLNNAVAPGQIGTGVQIAEYARLRDAYVDTQYRSQAAALGQSEARSTALDQLNQLIDEPGDSGLTSLLGAFWGSWQALSTNADSPAVREGVRSAGEALAMGFRDTHAQLVQGQTEASNRIGSTVAEANLLANQVNDLNQAIAKVVAVNKTPNDLLDQRDLVIDKIAKIGNVTLTPVGNLGRVTVALGGQVLVNGATDTTSALAVDAAGNVTVGGVAASVTDGSLRGLIDIRNTVIGGTGGYLEQLDNLVSSLMTEVNNRHAAGVGLDSSTGNAFFQGTGAADIALSAPVAASTDAIAAAAAAGDLPAGGDAAVGLAQLKVVVLPIGTNSATLDGYWASMVSTLGVDTDQAQRLARVQQTVLDVAQGRRDSTSGVNMDEEVADMVRFQQSYNAAARMITTLDGMLETIVNRMGMVGR